MERDLDNLTEAQQLELIRLTYDSRAAIANATSETEAAVAMGEMAATVNAFSKGMIGNS